MKLKKRTAVVARLRKLAERLDYPALLVNDYSQYICDNLQSWGAWRADADAETRYALLHLGMGTGFREFADCDSPRQEPCVRTPAKQNARVMWLLFAALVLEDRKEGE